MKDDINKNVPKLAKPVARLGIAAYPKDKAGEIFIDEMPHPSEAITGEPYRNVKPNGIRDYAVQLLVLADLVDTLNGINSDPNPMAELAKWEKIANRIWQLGEEPFIHESEFIELEEALSNCTVLSTFQIISNHLELSLESASMELEHIRDTGIIISDSNDESKS